MKFNEKKPRLSKC